MDDLISRQAAIEAIRHIEEVYINNLPTMIDKASAQTELMMLPSAQPEQRWIPVSERLPFAEYGEGDRVYCYCHDEKLGGKWAEMLYFNGGVWCKPTGETFDYKVLAWYPLPTKPYRAERREDGSD